MSENFTSNKKDLSGVLFKIILNAIVIIVFYTNFAFFFNFSPSKFKLPVNKYVSQGLFLYSVFASYVTTYRDCVIKVLVQDEKLNNPPYWERLDPYEYFPFKKGERILRFRATFHKRRLGKEAKRRAHEIASRKIKERYNRMNPGKVATKVEMGIESWPRTKGSYYQLKTPKLTKYWIMYTEK